MPTASTTTPINTKPATYKLGLPLYYPGEPEVAITIKVNGLGGVNFEVDVQ